VDDARLVVLNAIDARERGAEVLTRWRCVDAQRGAGGWDVRLQSRAGDERRVHARALVNAAGPWAGQFLAGHAHLPQAKTLRLVKGSHIVVPRLFDHDHAYILQNPDKRIIFMIPYEREFTLIGTTDVEHTGPIGQARIEQAEVDYLCEQASRYLAKAVRPADVVWTYSGVRPLLDDESGDPSAVTRDYQLELDTEGAPLLTVWGGKITTFRKLAEEAADLVAAPLALGRGAWTAQAALPGGDLGAWIGPTQRPDTDFAAFEQAFAAKHPTLAPALCHRLARAYGTLAERVFAPGAPNDGLGAPVAPGLYESELHYLHAREWARSADDVLWRRSKLGLQMTSAEREAVAKWCSAHWDDALPGACTATAAQEAAWN
jgi:glycerol-3-phosphate dehydrogenase